MNYVSKMVEWLNDSQNQVPRTPNTAVLEPFIVRMCEEFEVLRRNKDATIAVELFREGLQTTKPSVLRDSSQVQDNWFIDAIGSGMDRPIWNRLQNYLIAKRGRSAAEVAHVNTESDAIANSLRNPQILDPFQHRGMVVGYVQSGKTTNMSALIAKASDAGYRCVVVLAGVLDTLRQQTQFRFQQELFGYRQSVFSGHQANASCVPDDDSCRIKAVTDCDPNRPAEGEITEERLKALFHDYNDKECWNTTRVFVIKKTTTRIDLLSGFFKSLQRVHAEGKFNVPTLVIDDECDQATINTKFRKGDVTAINRSIRSLLANLRRNTYVGYTATPFANLFIDPHTDDDELGRDLYPKDFIATLTPPPHYTGTKELFGITSFGDPELDRNPLDIIMPIPESEHKNLANKEAKGAVVISHSENQSLYNAILDFLVSCALQQKRNRESEDMTMLIHPSAYKNIQNRIFDPLVKFVETLQLKRNESNLHIELKRRLDEEFIPRSNAMKDLPYAGVPEQPLRYEEISESINEIIGKLEVVLLHGSSSHVLRYGDKQNPKRYIVVGGNKLSRGLTLEGLSVSYFLRKSASYDTLLQMGRWFGYRAKYVDLTRLYMSEQMRDFFSALAYVELDMRSKFEQNYLDARTPAEVPTHIAKIAGISIVAGNKMGAASVITESYGGRFLEQSRLDVENPNKIVQRNHLILTWLSSLPAPEKLLSNKGRATPRLGSYLWAKTLASSQLADVLEPIDLSNIKKELIQRALRNQSDSTDIGKLKWYVAVGGKESGAPVGVLKCGGGNYPIVAVNRKLKNIPNSVQLLRLISGGEISYFIRPKIAELGDDPAKVGIICVYFVNSNVDILWGDRLSNPPKSKTWDADSMPFIASISLIVPDSAKGTMYMGIDIPVDQLEDDLEVESDD